jgi:hypothetical protein
MDHSEVFYKLCSSPVIIKIIKSGIHTMWDTYVKFTGYIENE